MQRAKQQENFSARFKTLLCTFSVLGNPNFEKPSLLQQTHQKGGGCSQVLPRFSDWMQNNHLYLLGKLIVNVLFFVSCLHMHSTLHACGSL